MSGTERKFHLFQDIGSYGENIAIRTANGESITYSELDYLSDEIASKGLQTSSLAILECDNQVNSVVAYLAFMRQGIVPILLPRNLPEILFKNYLDRYKPKYVFTNRKWLDDKYVNKELTNSFKLLERIDGTNIDLHPDLAILITTSGSTGSPKLVRISDKNLISNSRMIRSSLPITESDVVITTMPFSYSYGLSILHTHLLSGATVVLNEFSLMQRSFWNLISETAVTTFGGVPFTFQQLLEVGFHRLGPNIKYLTQAGGRLPTPILEKILDACSSLGIEFFVMYGQTEATARMSVLNPNDAVRKKSSVGRAIPPGEFSLEFEDDLQLNHDHKGTGELIYRGDNVAMGYAETIEDLAKGDEWQGVLKTGDLAILDSEGFAYITGRKSRFAKIRGYRISLDDLESLFLEDGIETAIIELDSRLLVATMSADVKDSLKQILEKSTVLRATDFSILIVETFPRNSNGKIDYLSLKQSFIQPTGRL